MKLICVLRLRRDKRTVGLQDVYAHEIIDVHANHTSKAHPSGCCDRQSKADEVNHHSKNDRAQVDERGTGKPEVRDVGHRGTSVASRIAYHAVSLRAAQQVIL
jgi:hypothetical protein